MGYPDQEYGELVYLRDKVELLLDQIRERNRTIEQLQSEVNVLEEALWEAEEANTRHWQFDPNEAEGL